MRVTLLLACVALIAAAARLNAQETSTAPADDETTQAITRLREDLIDSFNKQDIDRLLTHLDDDVVVTWQDGTVCRGPAAVRDYYKEKMQADNHIVAKLTCDPKVDGRHVYGDWAVSWGHLNDEYVLTDGRSFNLDSRFTASIAKRGSEWKVTSYHASVDAFDNPILGIAARKAGLWGGVIGAVAGLIVGGGFMCLRRCCKGGARA